MLRKLSIENYALIDSLEIEFSRGLNTITGETGAGKSLLLGALSVVLGGKADVNVLRDLNKNCVVEAEFEIGKYALKPFFEREDIDYENNTVIRRVINPSGKSRAYINELPVGVGVLKELSAMLIDVHSQHQTLLLSENRFQRELIDSVANHDELLASYSSDYTTLIKLNRDLERLKSEAAESKKDEEFLRFQVDQLSTAKLREGEQAELELLLSELSHASEIKEIFSKADTVFNSDETGVFSQIKTIQQQIFKLKDFFSKGEVFSERLHSVLLELKDIENEISTENDRVSIDPYKLEKTEQRLDLLFSLQQKHRVSTVEELLEIQADYTKKLEKSENFDAEIEQLEKKIVEIRKIAIEKADKITANRKATTSKIESYVVATLSSLGIPNVKFVVDILPKGELSADGADTIKFRFSANKNGEPMPVEQVASGGEMSRLMLALKSLVAQHSQLPTIIFDEIDTGISGEVADKMGQIINSLSGHLQIINITHLPQVASKGDHHYFVYKSDTESATNTNIKKLNTEERIMEIAKMISGSNIGDAAIKQAKVLLQNRLNGKK